MLLSIMGLYEYDNTLFQGLQLPEDLDRESVINEILLQCAELEVVYPNIDIMKLAITTWSIANQYTWQKLYDTMVVQYNPIWNVDATETETETNERDISRKHTGANNETRDLTDKETPDIADIEAVQGFNSNLWSEAKRNTHRGADTFTHTGTDNITITNNETVNDGNERINTKRRTGNIGIVSTQSMIEQERQIAEFNMINYIAQSFKQRFCLLIY